MSWVRERDDQLLSVGNDVFVVDSRFSIEQGRTTGAWRLRLARVTQADAGDYTCYKSESASRPIRYRLVVVGELHFVKLDRFHSLKYCFILTEARDGIISF